MWTIVLKFDNDIQGVHMTFNILEEVTRYLCSKTFIDQFKYKGLVAVEIKFEG